MATGGGRFGMAGHWEMFDDDLGQHGARRSACIEDVVRRADEPREHFNVALSIPSPFIHLRSFHLFIVCAFLFNLISIPLECRTLLPIFVPRLCNFGFSSFTLTL